MLDAARQGDLDTVRHHIDSGVPVDLQEGNWTALMLTADKAVAALLIDRGASVDLQDEFGWCTALMLTKSVEVS